MVAATPTWHGTMSDVFDTGGARTETCASHDALLHDQRFLNGLLCERRRQGELVAQEWCK